MNSEKYHHVTSGADISINENNFEYDDTDLLSKMFNKDHNKSGNINTQDMQFTLQNKNERSRYQSKNHASTNKRDLS
jgi:hypothetical protein